MLGNLANDLVRTFLAPTCAACRTLLAQPLGGAVCPACWAALPMLSPPWCDRCGDALPGPAIDTVCPRCREQPPAFARARSAGRYDGPLRELIHALKYDRRRAIAPL